MLECFVRVGVVLDFVSVLTCATFVLLHITTNTPLCTTALKILATQSYQNPTQKSRERTVVRRSNHSCQASTKPVHFLLLPQPVYGAS
jgi:hypothetical protein